MLGSNYLALLPMAALCHARTFQVSELVQMLGALIRQLEPPLGLFHALENASRLRSHPERGFSQGGMTSSMRLTGAN